MPQAYRVAELPLTGRAVDCSGERLPGPAAPSRGRQVPSSPARETAAASWFLLDDGDEQHGISQQ